MPYSPNYGFILETIAKEAGEKARVLDYGCGAGELVDFGRERGLDMVGADIFQTDGEAGRRVGLAGKLGKTVFEFSPDEPLPFEEASFDAVCSNMVFEHVENLDEALSEIGRVLKPGGVFIGLYPTSETIREDHCGIPFVHWLPEGARYPYLLTWRSLGFGFHKQGKSKVAWARDWVQWLRETTFYRTYRRIRAMEQRHIGPVRSVEAELAEYRLHRSLPGPLRPFAREGVLRMANAAVLARKV